MLSYAAIPLPSCKVYVPIETVDFFVKHPKADWDSNKNDVHCPEHNVSFGAVTKLYTVYDVHTDDNNVTVYYDGIKHPRIESLSEDFSRMELNRNY